MTYALIGCRSITYAQRAVRLLAEHDIKAGMRRLPTDLPETGCGHAVRVEQKQRATALEIMNKAGFSSRAYFCEMENGDITTC